MALLRGTPTLYYGDELGVGHIEMPENLIWDPWAKCEPGVRVGRDPARTPMPWDERDEEKWNPVFRRHPALNSWNRSRL